MMTKHDPAFEAGSADDPRPVAAVIGAGFGGLAIGMRLVARGWRVALFDRLDQPGGRATAHHAAGYRFDLGPTIVTVPQLLEELWATHGRRVAEDVDIRPLDPFYRIRFEDGETFTARQDPAAMRAEIARLSPGDVAGYDRFMEDARIRYEFGFEDLGRRSLHDPVAFAKVLPRFGLLRADRSTLAHAALRVRDPRLQMALSFHPLFIGGDPMHVTSMYALVAWLERRFGVHYCMGGLGALARAMARRIEARGGRLWLGTEVDEITASGGRATGLRLADGRQVAADIVVSNADVGHTYQHLLRRHPRRRWTDRRLARSRWSNGLFVWYFGTRGTRALWPEIGHHTILSGPRYQGLLRDIFIHGRLAEDMSIYLHRPAVTDPSVAPAGSDAFYALVPVPHLGHAWPVDWTTERTRFRERLRWVLEATALPGLGAHLEAEHILTPADFRSRYLSPYGAGFSIEPRILQSAWFRPHNISEEMRGLYLVGAGCHPGAGLPGVVASAAVTDTLIPAAETVRA